MAKGEKFSLSQCSKNDFEKKEMQKIPYALVVRSLIHAEVCTRLNIAYVTGILGRYLRNLGVDHLAAKLHNLMVLFFIFQTFWLL